MKVTVTFIPSKKYKYATAICTRHVNIRKSRAVIAWRGRSPSLEKIVEDVEITYGNYLPEWIFKEIKAYASLPNGAFRELDISAGRLCFSHPQPPDPITDSSIVRMPVLEIGIHRLSVQFEPEPMESDAWSVGRGYSSLSVRVVGAPVPMQWNLPSNLHIRYPDPLPGNIFTARCLPGPPLEEGQPGQRIGKYDNYIISTLSDEFISLENSRLSAL